MCSLKDVIKIVSRKIFKQNIFWVYIYSVSIIYIYISMRQSVDSEVLFSHHITHPPGKIWPIVDFCTRQDNLARSKMTLLLHLVLFPSPPSIPSQGAEWAQMRDTLKNKLLIWDWVDSDGWPVLKGAEKRGGWVSLLFQWIQGADVFPHMAFSQSKGFSN